MSKPAIEVKNLSKVYNIGHERKSSAGTVTLRDAITNVIRKPAELVTGHKLKKEKFWALKDINFKVQSGDVVGIIGRNGSGKSTLLKVMSRIVDPTNGEIIMRGNTASLLEVGTGFHPELTGRENIYFNGSILGMKKKEIEAKFDEIVAFSEVEKFLDTPVKFYSSGMYVRLAFAVAAHLEPDILIVDEVLAVGDAAFQKKCLGKMRDVAGEGRTVLFVSHNMSAVQSLCTKCIYMHTGELKGIGSTAKIVDEYTENARVNNLPIKDLPRPEYLTLEAKMTNITIDQNHIEHKSYDSLKPLEVNLEIDSKQDFPRGIHVHMVFELGGEIVLRFQSEYSVPYLPLKLGKNNLRCTIQPTRLAGGSYNIGIRLIDPNRFSLEGIDYLPDAKVVNFKDIKMPNGSLISISDAKTYTPSEWQSL